MLIGWILFVPDPLRTSAPSAVRPELNFIRVLWLLG